jgi:choline-sulfatase
MKNLIILTCDELRADACGCMGNPDCRTPELDRLAAGGVVFTNHFSAHGKCVPSRIAMMTGRYAHTDGFRTIFQHLPPETPNLLTHLRRQGYETSVFGLNHMFQTLWDSHVPLGAYADYHSFTDGPLHEMVHRPRTVPPPDPAARPVCRERIPDYHPCRRTEPLHGFCDDNRTDQALFYLRELRDLSKPFFMQLNRCQPHPPYEVEEPWFSMYDPSRIRPWPHGLPHRAPLAMEVMRRVRSGGNPSEAVLREMQAVYYGMVSKSTAWACRVLDELDAQGLASNTVVLFTSDHGDFAGQYGLPEKWDTCLADCLLHVPCILRAPGLPFGLRVGALSQHIDLVPTLLELLGAAPADWGVHGASLLPALRGDAVHAHVFADGGHEAEMGTRFNFQPRTPTLDDPRPLDGKQLTYRDQPATMARTKMARSDRWKLVVRLAGGNELYDLQTDPHELDNLWPVHRDHPELRQVVADLQLALVEWCLRTDTDRPFQEQVGA